VWGCPNCRAEFSVRELPSRYTCYCGKVDDPPCDPWLPPHSCGRTCDRRLPSCDHRCNDRCHPHKCPPCPRVVTSRQTLLSPPAQIPSSFLKMEDEEPYMCGRRGVSFRSKTP